MGLISPKQLNDDPKLWLSVPHELHESLGKLQETMFPGFKQKLVDENVHCLECEGYKPFEVITVDTLERQMCTGYLGVRPDIMLRLTGIKEAGKD